MRKKLPKFSQIISSMFERVFVFIIASVFKSSTLLTGHSLGGSLVERVAA